jgi:hypothetical protein
MKPWPASTVLLLATCLDAGPAPAMFSPGIPAGAVFERTGVSQWAMSERDVRYPTKNHGPTFTQLPYGYLPIDPQQVEAPSLRHSPARPSRGAKLVGRFEPLRKAAVHRLPRLMPHRPLATRLSAPSSAQLKRSLPDFSPGSLY